MTHLTRRSAITASASVTCWAVAMRSAPADEAPAAEVAAAVTAPEDLMREQHRVGRMLTGVVLRHATADGLANDASRAEVTRACRDFVRMFRAHEAWEDTELFPAFRRLVSPARLVELGEQFEEIEHRTFGKDGFADTVRKVVQLEHRVGIQGPDAYTPREPAKGSP